MSVVLGQNVDRSHYEYEHRYAPAREPTHPLTRQLIDYWRACDAKGGLRFGRDIPARPIASLLKHIIVSEPVGDWEDARLRLAGFATVEYFGRDVTGLLLSEVMAGDRSDLDKMLQGARFATEKHRPGIVEHRLLSDGREVLRQEMTAVPILTADGTGPMILCSTFDFL